MSLVIDRDLETKIRARAEAEGLSIVAYLERLVLADQDGARELETLALEGLHSGAPIQAGPSYWQEKHRLLDERLTARIMRSQCQRGIFILQPAISAQTNDLGMHS